MTLVFFKLSSEFYCFQYLSKISSSSYNPFWEIENIAKSSAKSKDRFLALDNSGLSLSSNRVFCFSNNIGRSFINKLKNNRFIKTSLFLSSIDVLNGVETCLF